MNQVNHPYARELIEQAQRTLAESRPRVMDFEFEEAEDIKAIALVVNQVHYDPTIVVMFSLNDLVDILGLVLDAYENLQTEVLAVPAGTTLH